MSRFKSLTLSHPFIGDRKVLIPSPEKWGDRYQELIALYNKLLLRQ